METSVKLVDQYQGYSDAEVIQKVLNGEKQLFEILIRRNNPALYKTGRTYGFNHEDTEDLMQEAYINSYLHLVDFRHEAGFKTWLIRIMLNLCYQKKQKLSFKNEIPSEIKPEQTTVVMFNPNTKDNEHMMINKELGHIIEKALQKIPLDYRVVFSLRELNGLNVKETSEALDITESNVKVRLNRAKSMLKKELETMYSPADVYEFNLVYCDRIVQKVMASI